MYGHDYDCPHHRPGRPGPRPGVAGVSVRITEPQRQVLHLLMLEDDRDDPGWTLFKPPLHAKTVRYCEQKGLIEVSPMGMRLTDRGRQALAWLA